MVLTGERCPTCQQFTPLLHAGDIVELQPIIAGNGWEGVGAIQSAINTYVFNVLMLTGAMRGKSAAIAVDALKQVHGYIHINRPFPATDSLY